MVMDDEEEKPSRGAGTPSHRETKRQRRHTAGIVAQAVRDLRPEAPLQEIRRLVVERCATAGLPAPSPKALVAKIADVRRFEYHPKMLILDRCYLETTIGGKGPEIATMHVAILHPPGRIIAYRLIAGPPEDAIDAELLIELQSASGSYPDVRVRLAASGSIEDRIRAALVEARLTPVTRTTRWAGEEARRALGPSLLPDRIRLRLPRAVHDVPWAAPRTIELLRIRIHRALGMNAYAHAGRGSTPMFGLASPHLASAFVRSLSTIAFRPSE